MINYLDNVNAKGITILPEYIKLDLSRAELFVYSIIMQYTLNSKEKAFQGSLTYLSQYTKLTRQGVLDVLTSLKDGGYITREDYKKDGTQLPRVRYMGISPAQRIAADAERQRAAAAKRRADEKTARRKDNRAAASKRPHAGGFVDRPITSEEIYASFPDLSNFETVI